MLFDLGVYLTVVGTVMLILINLGEPSVTGTYSETAAREQEH